MKTCKVCGAETEGASTICETCKAEQRDNAVRARAEAKLEKEEESKVRIVAILKDKGPFRLSMNGHTINELSREELLSIYLSTIGETLTDKKLINYVTRLLNLTATIQL